MADTSSPVASKDDPSRRPSPRPAPEVRALDPRAFRERTLPSHEPLVIRGLVRDWPLVLAGLRGPEALADYVKRFDNGRPVSALVGPPTIKGRFHYNDDLTGFNFRKATTTVTGALDLLAGYARETHPAALAVQSAPVREHLPGLEAENPMPLLGDGVAPRAWIGNRVVVAAHHDPSENIACVAAGRRRFTLFPPRQVGNLYLGPFELTPAGAQISMVDFDAPDLGRFPRFEQALDEAWVADLEAGDALYIPYLWWHHVRSADPLNILINYWWAPSPSPGGRPLDALMHAMLTVRDLEEPHRDAWRAMFDHYVFQDRGRSAAHLPPGSEGVQGPLDPRQARTLLGAVARAMGRP